MLQNWCEAGGTPAGFWQETPRTVMAAIRGYHRRRGWMAWHVALLGRTDDFPELHEIDGSPLPQEDSDEDRAARTLANSRAWVIVTGGKAGQDAPEGES